MSDSVRTHRRQPRTAAQDKLRCPWDSPGKITGVGCHFLLQYMKVKSESEVAQSCPTLSNPMDCSLPGSSVHGIFPGKSTGVGAIAFSIYYTAGYKKKKKKLENIRLKIEHLIFIGTPISKLTEEIHGYK